MQLHRLIPNGELHNPKDFAPASNGDGSWKNEIGSFEWNDRDVLPAALSFVDGSVAPPTENTGDIYVLFSGGSVHADWDGISIGDWARFDGTNWNSITPSESIMCYNKTGNALFAYNGSAWEEVGAGENISTANLTFDASYTADLNGSSWTIEDGVDSLFVIDSNSIEMFTDVSIDGSDDSVTTIGFGKYNNSGDLHFDIRNNGQIGYGGDAVSTIAHKFYDPANSGVLGRFYKNDNTIGLNVGVSTFDYYALSNIKTHEWRAKSGVVYFEMNNSSGVEFLSCSSTSMEYSKSVHFGSMVAASSEAILELTSTTKAFLPPRMTTTQKNLLTDEIGLVVYDSTLNKLCVNNGSGWETITSV